MNNRYVITTVGVAVGLVIAHQTKTLADGYFKLSNSETPTRLDSTTGPRAGSNVVSMALVGSVASTLIPVGDPIHNLQGGGIILPALVDVPFANDGDSVFVEMAVWDASKWGLRYDKVPPAFVGYSDVVSVALSGAHSDAYSSPLFTRAAIVPQSVPEPSEVAMLVMGLGVIGWQAWRRR